MLADRSLIDIQNHNQTISNYVHIAQPRPKKCPKAISLIYVFNVHTHSSLHLYAPFKAIQIKVHRSALNATVSVKELNVCIPRSFFLAKVLPSYLFFRIILSITSVELSKRNNTYERGKYGLFCVTACFISERPPFFLFSVFLFCILANAHKA